MSKRKRRPDDGPRGRTYPGVTPADVYQPDATVRRERRAVEPELIDMAGRPTTHKLADLPDPYLEQAN